MPELTEDKTRRLLLLVEALAIGTAAILILIDYKIKQDLVALFRQIEAAMTYESRLYTANTTGPDSYSAVFGGPVVGDNPVMEKANAANTDQPETTEPKQADKPKGAVRRTGNRSQKIPDTDKPVGS